MPRYAAAPADPSDAPQKTGIVLINLGTPEAPTAEAVRRYLKEFLSDPRVVEIPRLIWWPILNGIILNTRPAKSAAKYAAIWSPEGSPRPPEAATPAATLAKSMTIGWPALACSPQPQ